MRRSLIRWALLACAAALVPALPAGAQIPDEFTNLKLLDEDIAKRELVGIMRDWAGGLGVRCNHCHVGPDDLQGMDFASDEKETKRAARVMLEMSRAINRQYVGSWEADEQSAGRTRQVVSCFTCHRGQARPPRKLTWILGETALGQGVDAAMAQYKQLKAEYDGAGVYDFREGVFGELAQAAFEAGHQEAAAEILRQALEIYPESANLHAFLGMALLQGGDAAAADERFGHALELDPENAAARRGRMMLEQMRQREEAPEEGE